MPNQANVPRTYISSSPFEMMELPCLTAPGRPIMITQVGGLSPLPVASAELALRFLLHRVH